MTVPFVPALVSSVVGFLVSFAVEYIPGLKEWWARTEYRALIMAGLGALTVIALVAMSYTGAPVEGIPQPFIWDGLLVSVMTWYAFLTTNQVAYNMQKGSLKRKERVND